MPKIPHESFRAVFFNYYQRQFSHHQAIKFVKNWDRDFNHLTFAAMKRFFPATRVFKALSSLVLIFVLVLTPCGIKQSVKQIFSIETNSSSHLKTTTNCQFVQTQVSQQSQKIAVLHEFQEYSNHTFTAQNEIEITEKKGIRKARSVPLYILYRQLRTSLV